MHRTLPRARTVATLAAAIVIALALGQDAFAHAAISPPVVLDGHGQLFSLTVPTEEEGLTTTQVELTVPEGFSVFSFSASPGWQRTQVKEGSGEDARVKSVKWRGGAVPFGQAAVFQFVGLPRSAADYRFSVRQTYSDGSVVNWAGPEDSDKPAAVVEAKSSFGGGGGSTLGVIALVVAAAALLVGIAGIVAGGRRPVA